MCEASNTPCIGMCCMGQWDEVGVRIESTEAVEYIAT
jgi:hypothetical protein